MALKQPEMQKNEATETDFFRAFCESFEQELEAYVDAHEAKRGAGPEMQLGAQLRTQGEEVVEQLRAMAEKETNIINFYNDRRGFSRDHDTWSEETKSFDKLLREARGLMEEMRWERQRLARL